MALLATLRVPVVCLVIVCPASTIAWIIPNLSCREPCRESHAGICTMQPMQLEMRKGIADKQFVLGCTSKREKEEGDVKHGSLHMCPLHVSVPASVRALSRMIVTAGIMTTNLLLPVEYHANTDYPGVFSHTNLRLNEYAVSAAVSSEESRVVGEAWKILDKAFVDKKFSGNDWNSVRRKYVRPDYKNTEEAYTAIREMTALLGDTFTRFLTPAQYETLQSKYTADAPAAGLGVELSLDAQGRVVVGGVNPGSPATKAGISTGDVVRSIDNQLTEGLSADEVAAMMRGKAGTAVAVTLVGMDGSDRAFTVERATLSAAAVTSKLQGRIGVIKIPSFAKTTAKTTTAAVAGLLDKGAEALILDLRGNLGGYFPAGVELAKELLPPDKNIVSVKDREGKGSAYSSEEDAGLKADADVPLILLVDRNTASAAEVFAAALQENGRALVVGEQTYGKGLVQTIARLQDGSALVVTVARYETPLGRDINRVGIQPDFVVKCAPLDDLECVPQSLFGKASSLNEDEGE